MKIENIEPEDVNENTLIFLYQSINDMQATIRSIDTKLGFILILNIIPITNMGKIIAAIFQTVSADDGCIIQIIKSLIIVMCAILWLLACVSTFRGITAIDNPVNHVKTMDNQANGIFYSGGLYDRNIIDALFNRSSIISKKAFAEFYKDMPATNSKILKELSFEKMKLAYIRDMKLIRQLWAFRFTTYWIIMGFIIYTIKANNVFCTVSR